MFKKVSKRGLKTAELHTQGPRYESSVNLFFFLAYTGAEVRIFSESIFLPCLYHITEAYANSRGFTSSSLPHVARGYTSVLYATHANSRGHIFNLPLTQCMWSRFYLASHPCHLRGNSAENTWVLFTLGNRSISCYFCLTKVRPLPLHRQISMESLS